MLIARIFRFSHPDLIIRSFAAQKSLYGFAQIFIAARWFSRCSRRARTLRCSRFCCSLFFFRSFFSHGMHGTHGNAVAAPACHSELVSPTNFTNVYRYAIGFISHRLHRFKRFFILIIRFAFLLCKNRSTDLHRFFRSCDRADARAVRPYKGGYCVCEYFFVIL